MSTPLCRTGWVVISVYLFSVLVITLPQFGIVVAVWIIFICLTAIVIVHSITAIARAFL
jgi:hypothetical protein